MLWPAPAKAQQWMRAQQWGGPGNDIGKGLIWNADGSLWLAGVFERGITWGTQTLTARGASDIFIALRQADGSIAWARRAGSAQEDELANIATDAAGNLICAGSYWIAGDFDTIQLSTQRNPKALFVAKYTSAGAVLWAQSVDGQAIKSASDVICDAEGNIWLTGYFSDSLFVADTILVAAGQTDLFVIKLSPEGQLHWALRQGLSGDTRAMAIGIMSNGDAIIAGFFNEITSIADTLLVANTSDRDMFLSRIRRDGQALWARRGGGVFDKDVTALVIDATDQIWLTGYLVGVMRLSESLVIQSATGNPDFFILQYSPDGIPLKAKALGGNLIQQATSLSIQANQLLVAGFYQGRMAFDGFQWDAGNTLSGFVAAFDTTLTCQWGQRIEATQSVFPFRIAAHPQHGIAVTGSFNGAATFDTQTLNTPAGFNIFLGVLDGPPITPISARSLAVPTFSIFPNPTHDRVWIATEALDFEISLFNAAGIRLWHRSTTTHELSLEHLPKGLYYIQLRTATSSQTLPLVLR